MLHFCHADLFGIFLCTPVFFVKTKSPVFHCGNKEGGKKGYLTIPDIHPSQCYGEREQEGFPTSGNDKTKELCQLN